MGRTLIFFSICILSTLSQASDWSHWRGENRSDVSSEPSGWDKKIWPIGKPLWEINVGEGASSPLAIGGKIYSIGWTNNTDVVHCIEAASGQTLWQKSYPGPKYGRHAKGDQHLYRGTTSTPEFDSETGFLFTLSSDGHLSAWDTKAKGQLVWQLNLYDRFKTPRRPQITSRKNTLRDYGYTTAPLVAGNVVIVEVGSPQHGNMIAFDKRSGEQRWASENQDPAGHSGGLAPMTIDDVPCIAVATSWHALVVRIDGDNAGKTVAKYEWKTDFSNTISGVAVSGRELLISSRYNQRAMVKISFSLKNGAKLIWRNKFPSGVCTPVIHKGRLYFANKGIHCIDFESGKLIWEGGRIGDAGSCFVTADDRLIVWGNSGDLALVETSNRSAKKITVLSEKKRVFDGMAWPHVVAANGRLFCKNLSGDLVCFSLTKKTEAVPEEASPKRRRPKK
jgi:outer membrane protein assembly factor BamB